MRRKLLSLAAALALCLSLAPMALAAGYTQAVPCVYEEMNDFSEGCAMVRRDGKCGFIDTTGREVVPCEYDMALPFSEGLAAVCQWNEEGGEHWGFVDKTGRVVIPLQYVDVYEAMSAFYTYNGFSEGLAAVSVATDERTEWGSWVCKMGAIDKTGKVAVPFVYDELEAFEGGVAPACKGELWGAVDAAGNEVVPFVYQDVGIFSGGLAPVRRDGWYGVVNAQGKEVVPCVYSEVFVDGTNGVVATKEAEDGTYQYMAADRTGKVIAPLGKYSQIGAFHEGLADVKSPSGTYGFIDNTGKEVIPCKYEGTERFSEGLAAVKVDGKWGLVDKTGKLAVPALYNDVGYYSEGLVAVEQQGKAGYVDGTGKVVVPFQYDGAMDFQDGIGVVRLENKGYGLVDKTGRLVTPCQYWSISVLEGDGGGLVRVRDMQGQYGVVDLTGRVVVPCGVYDEVSYNSTYTRRQDGSEGELIVVWQKGMAGVISLDKPAVAYASTQTVTVDGKAVEFQCYALKDQNGNPTNYIKLRDLAYVLNGTQAQFALTWDGSVGIQTKTAYTPNGTEFKTPFVGDRTYKDATAATKVNGQAKTLGAFLLTDDAGGDYTYYQLRDLAEALNFNIGWKQGTGIYLETNKPYDPAN